MAHPGGGSGSTFSTTHSFAQARAFVAKGRTFRSTTGERIKATQSLAKDGLTPTIVFTGERTRHGSVCWACWGFREDCNGSWIGQCAQALDSVVP
jgi:hypothetical protein